MFLRVYCIQAFYCGQADASFMRIARPLRFWRYTFGMPRDLRVRIYGSFKEENAAEDQRRALMTHEDRMREFEAIQERMWGEQWRSGPIEKVATWEWVDW